MNQFLDDLEFFCTASLKPPQTPDHQAALEALDAMEHQSKTVLGREFYKRFDELSAQLHQWELTQTFQAGLRFGADFALTVWGQSSQTAEP